MQHAFNDGLWVLLSRLTSEHDMACPAAYAMLYDMPPAITADTDEPDGDAIMKGTHAAAHGTGSYSTWPRCEYCRARHSKAFKCSSAPLDTRNTNADEDYTCDQLLPALPRT